MNKIKFDKIIYWHDWTDEKNEKIDLETQVLYPLKENGIEFEKIETTDRFNWGSYFDVLFFDYGGVGLGNSCLSSFCEYIYDDAVEHPSRYYVMVSDFTTEAMKEIKQEREGSEKIANVFDSMDEFIEYCKSLIKLSEAKTEPYKTL